MAVKTIGPKTKEKAGFQEEVVISAPPLSAVSEAATEAAEVFAPEELEQHAQVLLDAWEAKLKMQSKDYTKRAMAMARGEGLEMAEPITGPIPYPWWNLLAAGPYQITGGPGGPFLPNKIIQATEVSFLLCILWRNPACINWMCPGPSAATVMSAYDITIHLETVNLTNVTNGPDFGPFTFSPIGAGYLNSFFVPLTFPAPPQGKPDLYEINMTADVSGPVPGLPFAGYSTWVFDPDLEPPVFPPFLRPGVPAHWDHDKPCRFMVYTA